MAENGGPPANRPGAAGDPGDDEGRLDHEVTGDLTGLQQSLPAMPSMALDSVQDARRGELCEAAVAFARRGWRVLPVQWTDGDECACSRGADCASKGKHPIHDEWHAVASADPLTVAHWWRPESPGLMREWFPRANVGIATGRQSGIFALDVDTYAGGSVTLGAYERRHGPLPETYVHSTARGGTHFLFEHPGFDVRNSAAKVLGKGVDVRGEHGFIVAPPSRSAHGLYELNPAHAGLAPAPAPEWLLDMLRSYDRGQVGAGLSGAPPAEATGAARRYAEAAVRAEAERMRTAAEGTRNDTLNQCAFSLGTLGGAGLLTEEAAYAALREAAMAAGLGESEIRGTFLSGWRKGLESPRNVQWRAMEGEWPTRPRTEFGLADRFADHYGDLLRWCPELNTWMRYEGGVWRASVKEAGDWAAQMMIRRLDVTEALSYDDGPETSPDGASIPSPREAFLDWVAKQQTRKAVTSTAALARGLPLMQMPQASFDASPLLLNVQNGVVDLSTGELLPHSPERRMTLQAAASYYPGEQAPRWEAFLRKVQPDPEMRAYLQRVMGYSATGLTTEQVFFLFHGNGANGKGVFQHVQMHVLGTYAQTVPVDTLMASSVDGRIPNDIARMAGRRYLVASETKQGKSLDEQRIKSLTGGDTIAARYMRAEYFEFTPVGKIQLTTNHLPRLSDDSATWRRIHLVPWPVQIPEGERDGFLQETLIREESAGILAWIIEGALAWAEEGLNPPQTVHDAREAYKQEEDVVGQFIADCLEEVPPANGMIGRSTAEIFAAFEGWCRHEKIMQMPRRAFTSRLKKRAPQVRSNGWTGFPSLQVRGLLDGGPSA